MINEIQELFEEEEIADTLRTQTMAASLYNVGKIASSALHYSDLSTKEDLLEALQMVYNSVCETAALVELTGDMTVH